MNDLISRSALIESMKSGCDMQDLYLPIHFLDFVEDAPTVEAVPTSTIQRAIDNIGCVARSTTNADFINGCTASLIELDRALKTNCGADMRGEKNGTL